MNLFMQSYLYFFIFVLSYSCRETRHEQTKDANDSFHLVTSNAERSESRVSDSTPVVSASDEASTTSGRSNKNLIYKIIFGIYCGHCRQHCAIMYDFNNLESPFTLKVDSTDSYLKKHEVDCITPIHDRRKVEMAHEIISRIPKAMLQMTDSSKTFGCPDCADQCGIYLQVNKQDKVTKYYMDHNVSQLPVDIRPFAEYLVGVIDELKKK